MSKEEKERNEEIERGYSEDFSHENGNYTNICCRCKECFLGHKRRVICKSCLDEALNQTFGKEVTGK